MHHNVTTYISCIPSLRFVLNHAVPLRTRNDAMVLGIITAIAACPAIIGTTEAVRQGQRQNAREEHRGRKSNLTVTLPVRNSYSTQFDGAMVVLKDSKLWVDTEHSRLGANMAHPFTGYYLPYPGKEDEWRKAGFRNGEGMVTTISDDPPFLNWVFVDHETHEVKYGVRAEAQPHVVGPWDCTKVDRRLTFEGWEGFIAVEEEEGSDFWAVYFDRDDDGLQSGDRIGTKGKRMLAIELWRREIRKTKDASDRERIERVRKQADDEKKEADTGVGAEPDEKGTVLTTEVNHADTT